MEKITKPIKSNELEETDEGLNALPTKLGIRRDENTVGYEKRAGQFAGDAGRSHMKTYKGR